MFHSTVTVNNNIAGTSCAGGNMSMNSKCYSKFNSQRTWWSASNDCVSRGGSLAVFTDIGRPSNNSQLNHWLATSGTDKTYWIGLIIPWWKTTNDGNIWHYGIRFCMKKSFMMCRSFLFHIRKHFSRFTRHRRSSATLYDNLYSPI